MVRLLRESRQEHVPKLLSHGAALLQKQPVHNLPRNQSQLVRVWLNTLMATLPPLLDLICRYESNPKERK